MLCKNVYVCAVDWPGEKKINDLGCAVLYLSVLPCTQRNIEGRLKNLLAYFEKHRKSVTLVRPQNVIV